MEDLMKGSPPSDDAQVTLKNWRTPPFNKWAFSNVRNVIPTERIVAGETIHEFEENQLDLSDLRIAYGNKDSKGIDQFLKTTHTDAFLILQHGKLVYSWFGGYGSPVSPHIIFSISKSITALTALSLANEGVLDTEQQVSHYLPEISKGAYCDATVRNLLDMNVSSTFVEDYLDKTGIFNAYRNATGWNECHSENREGLWSFLPKIPKNSTDHGKRFHYCSPHTDMLGWVIERTAGQQYAEVIRERILSPCGTQHEAYVCLDYFGAPRAAGGINICAADLAKVGELVRCDGYFNQSQILPESLVRDIKTFDNQVSWKGHMPKQEKLFPSGRYRSNWYQTWLPDEEVCGIGIHGQWLWVNPAKSVTLVKLSSYPLPMDMELDIEVVKGFRQITEFLS